MLAAHNLIFRAGRKTLIDNVSASFEPGKLHVIVGPNGAGKSTLLKLLSRLLRPHSGQVAYGDFDAARCTERELAKCRAILSQAIEVAFPLPVNALVMMGRYPHFRHRPAAVDERICIELMEYFDISSLAERSYETLSGGEKQRVNFARVLAQIWHPVEGSLRYLFLDEPLTFLDIRHQIDLMKKMRTFALQKDVVAVGVLHDLNLAARFADRLILLHQGRVLAEGLVPDVLTPGYLRKAFEVTSTILKHPASGDLHLTFE